MTSPRNHAPADIWETLQRLRACNKTELAAALGVSRHTLRRWMDEDATGSAGKTAHERAAMLLQATLRAANADTHAQWAINWQAIDRIGGRK